MADEIKITALELTVLIATLVDSMDAPDPDGKNYAFGRAARETVWRGIAEKLKRTNFKLHIQQ